MIEKASAVAAYGGGTTAVYFGLSAGEWQVLGVLGGLVIGAIGLAVNTFFKWKHYRLAVEQLESPDAG